MLLEPENSNRIELGVDHQCTLKDRSFPLKNNDGWGVCVISHAAHVFLLHANANRRLGKDTLMATKIHRALLGGSVAHFAWGGSLKRKPHERGSRSA